MIISIENVSKKIQGATVLDNVNLRMESGNIYGLLGRNGSGKTMLMRAICGLLRPTEGKIMIDGTQQWKDFSFPPDLGMLIETPTFLPEFTGFENLEMLSSIRKKVSRNDIRETIAKVGLMPDDKRITRKYSLGMRQRLGIACAIMEQPQLLILDEPFNGLDVDGYELVKSIILEEKQKGTLIVLACHSKEDLEDLSDVIYKVEQGRFSLYHGKCEPQ
uniref:ABC transporter ATP-binding protein n=1 Tax=Agathobacter sp. TaxID=2021311 RepID=UPI004056A40D